MSWVTVLTILTEIPILGEILSKFLSSVKIGVSLPTSGMPSYYKLRRYRYFEGNIPYIELRREEIAEGQYAHYGEPESESLYDRVNEFLLFEISLQIPFKNNNNEIRDILVELEHPEKGEIKIVDQMDLHNTYHLLFDPIYQIKPISKKLLSCPMVLEPHKLYSCFLLLRIKDFPNKIKNTVINLSLTCAFDEIIKKKIEFHKDGTKITLIKTTRIEKIRNKGRIYWTKSGSFVKKGKRKLEEIKNDYF